MTGTSRRWAFSIRGRSSSPGLTSPTVMSKRRLLELVREKIVSGWDDPRMPTLSRFRRRGYTPEAIREFCARIGVAKVDSVIDVVLWSTASATT